MRKATQTESPATYHVLHLTISAVIAKDSPAGKYLMIEGLEQNGNAWHWRMELKRDCMDILLSFLRSFGYPADFLEPLQVKRSAIVGLEGKCLMEEREQERAIGFSRLDETVLDERLAVLRAPKKVVVEEEDLSCLDDL